VNGCNKTFLGNQPCQCGINFQFEDCLYLHHLKLMLHIELFRITHGVFENIIYMALTPTLDVCLFYCRLCVCVCVCVCMCVCVYIHTHTRTYIYPPPVVSFCTDMADHFRGPHFMHACMFMPQVRVLKN
jgi:hypothetical protein